MVHCNITKEVPMSLAEALQRATQLTRNGQLGEATRAIREALGGRPRAPEPTPTSTPKTTYTGDVIDVEPRYADEAVVIDEPVVIHEPVPPTDAPLSDATVESDLPFPTPLQD